MRSFDLARVAVEAEGVYLRQQFRRGIVQGILTGLAVALLAAGVVFLHIAAWDWLRESLSPPQVALIFAVVDLLAAAALAFAAAHLPPGPVEREALALRSQALDSMSNSMSITPVLLQLASFLINLLRKR